MADVVYAPLAELDGQDWHEFNDFALISALQAAEGSVDANMLMNCRFLKEAVENNSLNAYDMCQSQNLINVRQSIGPYTEIVECLSSEATFVNCDELNVSETICRCFGPAERIENLPPVEITDQKCSIRDSSLWLHITDTFNNVPVLDWTQTCACKLREKSLDLSEREASVSLDVSDDEELQQSMDLHSLITSYDHEEEPLANVDQVISEIEEMMEDDMMTSTVLMPKSSEIIHQRLKNASVSANTSVFEGLKALSVTELSSLVDELEAAVRFHSETLVTELAEREELDFRKELNNQFISLLLSIQRRRREAANPRTASPTVPACPPATDKKKSFLPTKLVVKPQDAPNACPSPGGVYLTTVIPYDHHEGPPDVNRLQIYIKIMSAIDSDSAMVPSLLTDYILKVLCPTT